MKQCSRSQPNSQSKVPRLLFPPRRQNDNNNHFAWIIRVLTERGCRTLNGNEVWEKRTRRQWIRTTVKRATPQQGFFLLLCDSGNSITVIAAIAKQCLTANSPPQPWRGVPVVWLFVCWWDAGGAAAAKILRDLRSSTVTGTQYPWWDSYSSTRSPCRCLLESWGNQGDNRIVSESLDISHTFVSILYC